MLVSIYQMKLKAVLKSRIGDENVTMLTYICTNINKSPKRSGETYCLLFHFVLLLFLPLLLSTKVCMAKILVTPQRSVLKVGDMVDMDVRLRYRLFKLKILDS